jgi:hypothetical protein
MRLKSARRLKAVAYSALPNWKVLLAKFVDRVPTGPRHDEKYFDGRLPTLDQISYQNSKPGMIDKIKDTLKVGGDRQRAAALDPSPELIDMLWGYYLATGAYQPIGRMIKLLPLASGKDNVANLTTCSAAKFALASNAVRDLHLLRALKGQLEDVAKVLNDVIDTADDVDTVRLRKESLAAIEDLKQKGPNAKRANSRAGAKSVRARCRWAAWWPRPPDRSNLAFLGRSAAPRTPPGLSICRTRQG